MRIMMSLICLILAGCSQVSELAKTEIIVHAPRAEVFDAVFSVDEIKHSVPLINNSGTDQFFEMKIDENSPKWKSERPKDFDFAKELLVQIVLEDRRRATIKWAINKTDVRTGVKWEFEDMGDGRTKISFDILPLEGDRSEGLTINQMELRLMARQSLDKIEAMARKRGGGVVESKT